MSLPWIIPAAQAHALIAEDAIVLDARKEDLRLAHPLPGAFSLSWPQLTYPDLPDKGRLLDDDVKLGAILSEAGLCDDTPIVVVADALAGGGEDGRLVWALRTLGHDRTALVNGGVAALGSVAIPHPSAPGRFSVRRTARWEARRDNLREAAASGIGVILDTREEREYRGETPHGEAQGGHVPGARHLWYRNLIAADGTVLADATLRSRLAGLGIGPDTEVIAYCTGRVRAAFVTVVLADAGYRVRNYAGSMWHWASGDPQAFPLRLGHEAPA